MSKIDSAQNTYEKISTGGGWAIRVTRIPASSAGHGSESMRIQIEPPDRAPYLGPEIPLEHLGEVIQAITNLLRRP